MSEQNNVIAQRIKDARKKAGMTQQELADSSGISFSVISQYENGRRNPKIETLSKIAKAIGIPVYELWSPVDDIISDINTFADKIKHETVEDMIKEGEKAVNELAEEILDNSDAITLFGHFKQLNSEGQHVLIDVAEGLKTIDKYQTDSKDHPGSKEIISLDDL